MVSLDYERMILGFGTYMRFFHPCTKFVFVRDHEIGVKLRYNMRDHRLRAFYVFERC